ncbi:hypothetical protein ACLKA6_018337 [Drosophila palustris]
MIAEICRSPNDCSAQTQAHLQFQLKLQLELHVCSHPTVAIMSLSAPQTFAYDDHCGVGAFKRLAIVDCIPSAQHEREREDRERQVQAEAQEQKQTQQQKHKQGQGQEQSNNATQQKNFTEDHDYKQNVTKL